MRSKDSPKQYCFFLSAKAELPFSKVESKYFFFSTINDYNIPDSDDTTLFSRSDLFVHKMQQSLKENFRNGNKLIKPGIA